VRAHEEVAFRVAYLIVRDEADAQDVAQEAFVRAYRSLGRFDASQPFRPWLLRIVTNLALNNRRSFRRRREMQERYQRDAATVDSQSPVASAERAEEARVVWDAVARLEPRDQTLVYLRYFLDASEAEAAAAIGRPVGTVKSRLHRALRRLRATIEEHHPELLSDSALVGDRSVPS
jgi:RNA polymerase sigma-70 factor (ECF subfamily)